MNMDKANNYMETATLDIQKSWRFVLACIILLCFEFFSPVFVFIASCFK